MRKAATFEQFGLSFVAGYADTLSFIAMSGLFTAHVTGNMVLAAAHVSGQGGREAVSNLVMIPVFMLAVALVALLARTSPCTGRTPAQRVRLFLALELILLTAFWWAGVSMATAKGFPLIAPADVIPVAMLGVAALAIQNALPHITGVQRLPTTVMTGNLTRSAIDLATLMAPWVTRADPLRAEARGRLRKLTPGVIGFFAGAAIAAPMTVWFHFHGLALACVALLLTMPAAIAAAGEHER